MPALYQHRLIKPIAKLLPRSIAARLYCLGVLTLGSVLVLALGAMVYLYRTEHVVIEIRDKDVKLASASADIELLLERHRRIVESAPIQLDLVAVDRDRRLTEALADKISALTADADDERLQAVSANLEKFVLSGRKVLYYAANFAQAEAVDAIKVYNAVANDIQNAVRLSRANSIAAAKTSVAELLTSGRTLQHWVLIAAFFAVLIILPLSMLIIRSVIARINEITDSMRRIALDEEAQHHRPTGVHDEIGEMACALDVFKHNATTLMLNSREIEKLNDWFQIALNNMARGLSMFDADGKLLVCNSRYIELYGLPASTATPGTSFESISEFWCEKMQLDQAARDDVKSWFERLRAAVAAGAPFTEVHELGDGRAVRVNTQPLDGGGWVDLHEDITDKRAAEAQIEQLARFDALTGLANRHHFQERLEKAVEDLGEQTEFALLWLDLDRFKSVNDTLGHPSGDELLRAVADRLRLCVRSSDFIARLGGDEFAIIATVTNSGTETAQILGDRIVRRISAPYEIAGKLVSVGVSVGIVLAPRHGKSAEDLIRNADVALYRAKSQGRGRQVLFNDNLEAEVTERDSIEADLRIALTSDQLMLYYQPILNIADGRVGLCEALMRWKHPTRGLISPAEFIPIAEESGLIGAMGAWALRQACRNAVQWPNDIRVSVNVAATQFTASNVVGAVESALEWSGLPAHRLELEVTETIMLKDDAATLSALQTLREMGVTIALDDFGTGFASLSYLRSFPFDKIKIDKCFVQDITTSKSCFAIVQAIVGMTRGLGMLTVAEGVETAEALNLVIAAGCDEVQGYYFSRPVPAADLAAAFECAEDKWALAA
ncbi:MAG: EAL domain-containing protein [Hyphomicrobium sp.]|nr:EAL domain-containing protein [Hyphomicrobium sp.]